MDVSNGVSVKEKREDMDTNSKNYSSDSMLSSDESYASLSTDSTAEYASLSNSYSYSQDTDDDNNMDAVLDVIWCKDEKLYESFYGSNSFLFKGVHGLSTIGILLASHILCYDMGGKEGISDIASIKKVIKIQNEEGHEIIITDPLEIISIIMKSQDVSITEKYLPANIRGSIKILDWGNVGNSEYEKNRICLSHMLRSASVQLDDMLNNVTAYSGQVLQQILIDTQYLLESDTCIQELYTNSDLMMNYVMQKISFLENYCRIKNGIISPENIVFSILCNALERCKKDVEDDQSIIPKLYHSIELEYKMCMSMISNMKGFTLFKDIGSFIKTVETVVREYMDTLDDQASYMQFPALNGEKNFILLASNMIAEKNLKIYQSVLRSIQSLYRNIEYGTSHTVVKDYTLYKCHIISVLQQNNVAETNSALRVIINSLVNEVLKDVSYILTTHKDNLRYVYSDKRFQEICSIVGINDFLEMEIKKYKITLSSNAESSRIEHMSMGNTNASIDLENLLVAMQQVEQGSDVKKEAPSKEISLARSDEAIVLHFNTNEQSVMQKYIDSMEDIYLEDELKDQGSMINGIVVNRDSAFVVDKESVQSPLKMVTPSRRFTSSASIQQSISLSQTGESFTCYKQQDISCNKMIYND